MKLYRICFIALLLHGSLLEAWENQRPAHNAHRLNPLLNNPNPAIKNAAKSLLDSDQRVVKGLAPLLSSSNSNLQTAGVDLALITTTRSIDRSTTYAIIFLADLLQEKNSVHFNKAQELVDALKNSTTPEENSAIAREARNIAKEKPTTKRK